MAFRLTAANIKAINRALDLLFDTSRARLLGSMANKVFGKQLVIRSTGSLTHLFEEAAEMEGVRPRAEVLRSLIKIAGSYIDATREKSKAKVIQNIQAFMNDAKANGVKTDVKTVLGGQLSEVFADISKEIKRIAETESTTVRNVSVYDAAGRIGAARGEDDPVMFFICVHDNALCDECKRLHLLPNEVTPRVWKRSEIGSGYHKKGQDNPKINGLHPNERCVPSILLKGFGFDASGQVEYKSPDWDEYKHQRG